MKYAQSILFKDHDYYTPHSENDYISTCQGNKLVCFGWKKIYFNLVEVISTPDKQHYLLLKLFKNGIKRNSHEFDQWYRRKYSM